MYDAIVLGAGAAGLMCAATAGGRGRRVLVVDHAPEAGRKILISGGGRCNFTNLHTDADRFLSDNPAFCRSALDRYKPSDFVALVERHGISFHEKTLGQLFCDGSARAIVAMLLAECATAGVDIRLSHPIAAVSHADGRFRVQTYNGVFQAPALVVATGGPAIPKLGATGLAYALARQFGLRVTPVRPALVPLTFGTDLLEMMCPLSGVALEAVASVGRVAFQEAALFTHRGLSGPAVLQVSSYWRGGPLTLDLLPGRDAAAELIGRKRTRPRAELRTVLAELLPQRLAHALTVSVATAGTMADLPDRTLRALGRRLQAWTITPDGTEGFAKAEVAAGGIDTRDLSSKTMAALQVPGLHAIGEAVDVTGWLGGYNFQWAWASGAAAGAAL